MPINQRRDLFAKLFLIFGLIVGWGGFSATRAFGQSDDTGGMGGGHGGGHRGGGAGASGKSNPFGKVKPLPPQMILTPHGGLFTTTESNDYEIVFMPLQTRVYVYDKSRKPLDVQNVRVQMMLQIPGEKQKRQMPMQPVIVPPGAASQNYMVAAFDTSELRSETPITFEFSDSSKPHQTPASFTPIFSRSKIRPYVAQVLPTSANRDDVIRQRICPVCGDVLGHKGDIIKLLIGDYPLYVCSEDCMATIRQSPDKYLSQPQSAIPGNPQ
jgi:hypothetical protein